VGYNPLSREKKKGSKTWNELERKEKRGGTADFLLEGKGRGGGGKSHAARIKKKVKKRNTRSGSQSGPYRS